MFPPPHTSEQIRYSDFPPVEMSVEHIKKTIADFVRTAKWAVEECGFDGVEVHGGNGYLVEQFLASNVNKRTDPYGGSCEKRCAFALELMDDLSKAVGEANVAIRLSPFGVFNQIRAEQRLETWQTLCRRLKEAHPGLSYVSFIEPVRYYLMFLLASISGYGESTNEHSIALRASLQRNGKATLPRLMGSGCH